MSARFFTVLAVAVVVVSGTGCAQPTPTNIPPTPDKAAPAKTMTAGAVFLATLAAERDATEAAKPTDDPGAGATETAGAVFLATLAADRKQGTEESQGSAEMALCRQRVLREGGRTEGRDEWEYTGLTGFLRGKVPGDPYGTLPAHPWETQLLGQVGPELWAPGSATLPHKARVKVVSQSLTHKGYGDYEGLLEVEVLDERGRIERIDHNDFSPAPYWNCGFNVAREVGGPLLARVIGAGATVRAVDDDGQWLDVPVGAEVYCDGSKGRFGGVGQVPVASSEAVCFHYRQWSQGYGGIPVKFNSTDLQVTY